jgi:tRNA pseudouridine38-40 synthase
VFRLTVEYDGTDFHGWQIQPSVRTVAGTLRDALHAVTGEAPTLTAAGRTDAGAHAHGQVVGVALERAWDPERLRAALNASLPPDVNVAEAAALPGAFDARRDALSRTYRYVLVCRDGRSPVTRRHAWTVRGPLDLDAMREAASAIEGTHDFRAFGRPTNPGGSTVRTVEEISLETATAPRSDVVVITVRANAFLGGMMRAITGALVTVGRHRRPAAWVGELLATGADRPSYLPVAPAHGLHQWAVTYAPDVNDARIAA